MNPKDVPGAGPSPPGLEHTAAGLGVLNHTRGLTGAGPGGQGRVLAPRAPGGLVLPGPKAVSGWVPDSH